MEFVVLVNDADEPIGSMEKMEAHEKGLLHRAFSIFLFNEQNELLLQKRASSKYHSGGLWSNTCCSHPRVNEDVVVAGTRRLNEELGIVAPLKSVFSFIYEAQLDNDLTEHELDHVLIGFYSGEPNMNPEEVEDWKYIDLEALEADMKIRPEEYTVWFRIIFPKVREVLHSTVSNLAE